MISMCPYNTQENIVKHCDDCKPFILFVNKIIDTSFDISFNIMYNNAIFIKTFVFQCYYFHFAINIEVRQLLSFKYGSRVISLSL